MKPNSDRLSTMEYIWQVYERQPRQLAFRAQDVEEWRVWREQLRAQLRALLGGLPGEPCALAPQVVETVDEDEYRRERVFFYAEPGVAVPCYVLIPRGVTPPYRPVIALHGHGSDGARLLLGLVRDDADRALMRELNYDYARQLARRGFMVFAPVLRALGERNEPNAAFRVGEGAWEKSCEMVANVSLLLGRTLLGQRVWDVMRTVDYIRSRTEPMIGDIGCVGLSGGASVTLYTAALDDRLSVVVAGSAFCTYRASIMDIVHCPDNYVPGILRYAEMSDIAGLIAPRPLLVESGTKDEIFPIAGVRQAYAELSRVYALLGSPDRLDHDFFPGGHRFGRGRAFQWLDRWMGH